MSKYHVKYNKCYNLTDTQSINTNLANIMPETACEWLQSF